MIDVNIDISYLRNASLIPISDIFTICINNHQIKTSPFVARIFSPKINSVLLADSTTHTYSCDIQINDENVLNVFQGFLKNGIIKEKYSLNTIKDLYHIGLEFQNNELISPYSDYLSEKSISFENIDLYYDHAIKTHFTNKLADFIIERFNEFQGKSDILIQYFDTLGNDFIESIFAESLKFNQNLVLEIVLGLIAKSNVYIKFLPYVDQSCLSNESRDLLYNELKRNDSITKEFVLEFWLKPSIFQNQNIKNLLNIPRRREDLESVRELLHKAALEGDVQTIKYAIANGYCQTRNGLGHNIILHSSFMNDWTLVKMFIENGDDFNVVKFDNTNILHFFSQCKNKDACRYLVNLIDPMLETNYGPNAFGFCDGDVEIMNILRSRNS